MSYTPLLKTEREKLAEVLAIHPRQAFFLSDDELMRMASERITELFQMLVDENLRKPPPPIIVQFDELAPSLKEHFYGCKQSPECPHKRDKP